MMKKQILQHNLGTFEYDVIRSQRKTVTITVNLAGEVKVKAPYETPNQIIIEILNNKAAWVISKQQEMEQKSKSAVKREFIQGGSFPILGRSYPLNIRLNTELDRASIELATDQINLETPSLDTNLIKRILEIWYRGIARAHIIACINKYGPVLNVSPNRITIKEQKTRWGSCSSKGNLNFNWRLVMAPPMIIEYVVVHELCHLIHHNHSRDFWNLVESILPDYKECRRWLKNNGSGLTWEQH